MSCKTVPVSTPEMARRGEIVNSQLAAEPIVGNMTDVESPEGHRERKLDGVEPALEWGGHVISRTQGVQHLHGSRKLSDQLRHPAVTGPTRSAKLWEQGDRVTPPYQKVSQV